MNLNNDNAKEKKKVLATFLGSSNVLNVKSGLVQITHSIASFQVLFLWKTIALNTKPEN